MHGPKPVLLDAPAAHADGRIHFHTNGVAVLKIGKDRFFILPEQQFDLTQATIFGLNERLTMAATSPHISDGQTLRDLFQEEWQTYTHATLTAHGPAINYGVYAYYPLRNHLVRYAPSFWHRIVAVASSSMLLSDAAQEKSWHDIRHVFEHTTIGVAGCSVGSNVIHNAIMDLRPRHIKIADKSVYKLENINRIRAAYWDLVHDNAARKHMGHMGLKNKAQTVADQLYSIDPFLHVHIYEQGIDETNIEQFFGGNEEEPGLDMIIEEVDDPRAKILIREYARAQKIPLLMVTDAGSCIQLDVARYDLDPTLGLTHGMQDDELRGRVDAVYEHPGNRDIFFSFVDGLIGPHYRQGELSRIINQECEIPTATVIPQLGSTAAAAGAVVAEAIARIRLGHSYPPRMLFNKHTFEVTIFSE